MDATPCQANTCHQVENHKFYLAYGFGVGKLGLGLSWDILISSIIVFTICILFQLNPIRFLLYVVMEKQPEDTCCKFDKNLYKSSDRLLSMLPGRYVRLIIQFTY